VLAPLAIRILTTTANSVPSERAFSTMKLQHTKLRNRLSPTRVEKLVFIHINRRILAGGPKAVHSMKEEEVLQLERDLAVLVDEEVLYSELAQLQQDILQAGKRPASLSFTQGPGNRRWVRMEDHLSGTQAPVGCPEA
jgi:hAT family C-terminal dimerisation region